MITHLSIPNASTIPVICDQFGQAIGFDRLRTIGSTTAALVGRDY
jgi:hypothetical protein